MSPNRDTAPPMYATRGDAVAISYARRIAGAVSRIGYRTTLPRSSPNSASTQLTSASAAWTSAGPSILGTRTPVRPEPMTARRSDRVCPVVHDCTRANGHGGPPGSHPSNNSRAT